MKSAVLSSKLGRGADGVEGAVEGLREGTIRDLGGGRVVEEVGGTRFDATGLGLEVSRGGFVAGLGGNDMISSTCTSRTTGTGLMGRAGRAAGRWTKRRSRGCFCCHLLLLLSLPVPSGCTRWTPCHSLLLLLPSNSTSPVYSCSNKSSSKSLSTSPGRFLSLQLPLRWTNTTPPVTVKNWTDSLLSTTLFGTK
jgi:hypothetical protein